MILIAEFSFGRPNWLWPCAAILGVSFLLLLLRYGRARGMPGWARLAATGLKLLGIALLCACLVDLRWTEKRPVSGANLFLVLADGSRGMMISNSDDAGKTRGEILGEALRRDGGGGGGGAGEAKWQEALEGNFQVRRYVFGEQLDSVSGFEGMSFEGASSDMGGALAALGERYRNRPVAGILLLSDGNATDLNSVADLDPVVREGGIPVFPVVIGGVEAVKDLAIQDVRVGQTVFEDAPVTIEADVRCSGYRGNCVVLEMFDEEGATVKKELHTVAGDDEVHRFRLRLKPLKSGVLFYRLVLSEEKEGAKPSEGDSGTPDGGAPEREIADGGDSDPKREATLENNERIVLVDRAKGPYRILYVSGRPNWEYKFLRRALMADPQVNMVGLIRLAKREPKFQWRGRAGESSNPLFRGFGKEDPEDGAGYDKPVLVRLDTRNDGGKELSAGFPRTAEELFAEYHAIIIDDLEAAFFTRDQMELIEDFVSRRGGGFMMLGGQESFRGGEYENTPISHLLPVYLDRVGESEAPGNLTWDFTREGWLEPWLRLREMENQERDRLAEMPRFLVLNQLRAVKPGASVLATAIDDAERSFPAMVGQRYGEGRVLAVPVGDMWRWGFRSEAHQPDMAKAWRQAVRWLISDVPQRIAFTAVPGEGGGRRINLELRLVDEEFIPHDNAIVEFKVTDDTGKEVELSAEPSMNEAGLYEASFSGRREGIHRAVATVKDEDGELLGNPETGWTVDLAAEEFRNLKPNRQLMEDLAAETGGEMIALDALPEFAEGLPKRDLPVMELSSKALWHAPWVFLSALICFGAEWALRRRWGLA